MKLVDQMIRMLHPLNESAQATPLVAVLRFLLSSNRNVEQFSQSDWISDEKIRGKSYIESLCHPVLIL